VATAAWRPRLLGMLPDATLYQLIQRVGVSMAARTLKRSYLDVRDAALRAGIEIRRGRPVTNTARDRAIQQLHEEGWPARRIAQRYGITRQRVLQVLERQNQGDHPTDAIVSAAQIPTPTTPSETETPVTA